MPARNGANAVFPCGSGVVWRAEALEAIGDFPTWNLVEDLQSGVEALRRGWRGLYLPIVGAVPQHSPHDVPNFYKQRGTWALDTTRLVVWGDLRGLGLRQRLQFLELLVFYLASFTVPVYLVSLAAALLGLGFPPIDSGALGFIGHMAPLVVATELWLFVLNQPYNDRRARQRRPYRIGGPSRKPVYRVTLKSDDARWHWRHTLPQTTVVMTIAVVTIAALRFGTYPSVTLLVGSVYWGALNVVLLANYVSRGWHGLTLVRTVIGRARSALGAPT